MVAGLYGDDRVGKTTLYTRKGLPTHSDAVRKSLGDLSRVEFAQGDHTVSSAASLIAVQTSRAERFSQEPGSSISGTEALPVIPRLGSPTASGFDVPDDPMMEALATAGAHGCISACSGLPGGMPLIDREREHMRAIVDSRRLPGLQCVGLRCANGSGWARGEGGPNARISMPPGRSRLPRMPAQPSTPS